MYFLGLERSNHEFSRLGAGWQRSNPDFFLDWEGSDQELSWGNAQTMSFHCWERSVHEFSRLAALKPRFFYRLGALRTRIWPATTAFWKVAKNHLRNYRFGYSFEYFW